VSPVRTISGYGWKPSLPDQRDVHADASTLPVLPEVDPRNAMPPVYDQGALGSCTANAVAAAIQYDRSLNTNGKDDYTPSRLDIYYGERKIEGSPADQDTGAYGRDGFKFARRTGVFPENFWPYDVAKFAQKPPLVHRDKLASTYKVVPRSVNAFKRVLSNWQTIALGFTVYSSFEDNQTAHSGLMPFPAPNERVLGGHEVLVVGYLQDYPDHALVRNSWGIGWGMAGYFLMPWAVILDPNMSDDFRTIYRPAGK
jgi:C1A family cysteine protease